MGPPGRHILVVDDDTSLCEVLEIVLGKAGYRVSAATDGDSGAAKAAQDRPDLIIMDLMIPGLSGKDLLARLRLDAPQVPVIIITGRYTGDPALEAALRAEPNVADFFKKPLRFVDLTARVRALLGDAAPPP